MALALVAGRLSPRVVAAALLLLPNLPSAIAAVKVFGWGFDNPEAISSDGGHVWVANVGNNSIVELSATTGQRLRVLWGASSGIDDPESSLPMAPTFGWSTAGPVTQLRSSTRGPAP